jgi:glutamate dehydrogenase (NADP+)
MDVKKIMADLEKRNPGEVEYLQAVHEVLASIERIYNQNPQFEKSGIIERIVEPDRILTFKIPWVDDQGNVQVNRGYRVQFNNALNFYMGVAPSKRQFKHPEIPRFEQIFKNISLLCPSAEARGS